MVSNLVGICSPHGFLIRMTRAGMTSFAIGANVVIKQPCVRFLWSGKVLGTSSCAQSLRCIPQNLRFFAVQADNLIGRRAAVPYDAPR